ncbi:MAG: hypothetical protein R3B13_27830 [Polyangiaceae bacterium]
MRKIVFGLALVFLGCSSDDDGLPSGTGGAAGAAGAAGATTGGAGGASGSGAVGGASGSASGGVSGAASGGAAGSGGGAPGICSDAQNPMFGSCIEAFLKGCYQPDTNGTCSDAGGVTQWSDGSKFVRTGSDAGMYAPGATTPCIDVVTDSGGITATKGSAVLKYVADSATGMGTIHCPDGSSFTATFEQVTNFNGCWGIDCPGN